MQTFSMEIYGEISIEFYENWCPNPPWNSMHTGKYIRTPGLSHVCIYYIPHNYVIPQAMPQAISQTYSAFYPHHRLIMCENPGV